MNPAPTYKWVRVTRAHPCAICQKPDWCTSCEKWVCCMRVQSPTPAKNGGWLHPHDSGPVKPVVPDRHDGRPKINAYALMRDWRAATSDSAIADFAKSLGVYYQALKLIGIAWAEEYQAWAFPMKDGANNVVGIRLRDWNGRKWAVTGSRSGLFYGNIHPGEVCICEGPTDTAAALTLGLNVIGRPSCSGSEDAILQAIRRCDRVLIVSDNDGPGWEGALRLQLKLRVPSLCWSPPTKDLREFLRKGGNKELLNHITRAMVWSYPAKQTQEKLLPSQTAVL